MQKDTAEEAEVHRVPMEAQMVKVMMVVEQARLDAAAVVPPTAKPMAEENHQMVLLPHQLMAQRVLAEEEADREDLHPMAMTVQAAALVEGMLAVVAAALVVLIQVMQEEVVE